MSTKIVKTLVQYLTKFYRIRAYQNNQFLKTKIKEILRQSKIKSIHGYILIKSFRPFLS